MNNKRRTIKKNDEKEKNVIILKLIIMSRSVT